jgi:hypothetical protein
MSYNTKNYTEQGGGKTVIGGILEIKEGATVTGITATAAPASEASLGGIKASAKGVGETVEAKIGEDAKLYVPSYPIVPEIPVAENQPASTAEDHADLLDDFNSLLAKLKAVGLMAADA